MYIPDRLGVFIFALISAVCWGSWPNTIKQLSQRRIELYYLDFTLGMFLSAAILVTILGGDFIWNDKDERNFPSCLYALDNVRVVYALASGVTFNFGNFLLANAVRLTGLAVSLPAGIGISLIITTVAKYMVETDETNPAFLFGGLALTCIAVTCNLLVFKLRENANINDMNEPLIKDSSVSKQNQFQNSFCYNVSICILCGILLGAWDPLETEALKIGDGQLSAYTGYFFFSLAVLITTFPICSVSSKKPIFGDPFSPGSEYTKGGFKWHLLALIGGIASSVGIMFNLLGTQTAFSLDPGDVIYVDAIGNSAPLVAAFWGIFVWREFKNPSCLIIIILIFTFLLYVGSIVLISMGTARTE